MTEKVKAPWMLVVLLAGVMWAADSHAAPSTDTQIANELPEQSQSSGTSVILPADWQSLFNEEDGLRFVVDYSNRVYVTRGNQLNPMYVQGELQSAEEIASIPIVEPPGEDASPLPNGNETRGNHLNPVHVQEELHSAKEIAGIPIVEPPGEDASPLPGGNEIRGNHLNPVHVHEELHSAEEIAGIPMVEAPGEDAAPLPVWMLHPGGLKDQLKEWTDKEGYQLVWTAPHDYHVETHVTLEGDMISSLQTVIRGFYDQGGKIRAQVYQGNRVVLIKGE